MHQLDDQLWTKRAPMEFVGITIETRMTAVELPSDALWIHSPIPLDDELRTWVDDHGPVAYVVAPNRFHHVFVDEWIEAYPEATVCAAPGLPEKRDDLEFDHVLVEDGDPPWDDALDQQRLDGAPALNEVMFFHEPSRTMITADLLHNEPDPDSWIHKAYLWFNGTLGEPGINRVIRWFVYKDKHAVRQSLERTLTWNFDRLIVSHGEVIEPEARQTLRHVLEEELR